MRQRQCAVRYAASDDVDEVKPLHFRIGVGHVSNKYGFTKLRSYPVSETYPYSTARAPIIKLVVVFNKAQSLR